MRRKMRSILSSRTFLTIVLAAIPSLVLACGGDDSIGAVASDAGPDVTIVDANAPDAIAVDASDAASLSDANPDGGIVTIQILAFNDFHGNLRPPSPSNAIVIAKAGDPAIGDAGSPLPTEAGV